MAAIQTVARRFLMNNADVITQLIVLALPLIPNSKKPMAEQQLPGEPINPYPVRNDAAEWGVLLAIEVVLCCCLLPIGTAERGCLLATDAAVCGGLLTIGAAVWD